MVCLRCATTGLGFAFPLLCAGAGGNCDWADLYCGTTGYGFAFRPHRAAAWGDDDFAGDAKEAG